jgi:hypothetical protein
MMTIFKLLLAILILLQSANLYAGASCQRVMVTLFEGKDDVKGLDKKMSVICSEEVVRSKGFTYISPTDFVSIVTGNEKITKDKALDLDKEYSDDNMKYLQEMSGPSKGTLEGTFKALECVDIIVGGTLVRDGQRIKAEVMMVNAKLDRNYVLSVEGEEDTLESKIRKAVQDLLKDMSRPVKIYADKLIDAKNSVVVYFVKSMENPDIKIELDYTGDRPEPQVQSVNILPPDNVKKDGMAKYRIKCEDGGIVNLEFNFKDGVLAGVRVDAAIPDPSIDTPQSRTLIMKSRAGYALKFEFTWDKGAMTGAKLSPILNPFGNYDD